MARANKKAEEEESDAVKDVSMRRKKSRAAIEGVAADLRAETEAISKAASAERAACSWRSVAVSTGFVRSVGAPAAA